MSEYIKVNKHKFVIIGLSFLAIGIWSVSFRLPDSKLHVKVLSVGQGDSIFIRTPSGYKILVDGGPDDKVLPLLGEELPFYDRTLDLVVATHPQADHIGGLVDVVKRYNVKNIWTSYSESQTQVYSQWRQVLGENNLKTTSVFAGDKMIFPDGLELSVVWPRGKSSYTDSNTTAVVIQIDYKEFEGLLSSDADQQVQPYESGVSDIEFLKVPHHGSKTALKKEYLAKLSPQISVISAGEKNRYGHPNKLLLDMLQNAGTKVFRTDQQGSVEIVSDGTNWYTKTER